MRKGQQYAFMLLLLGAMALGKAHGQPLLICGSENFSNAGNLIDGNSATKATRDIHGIPATICIQAYQCNYISSITINIEEFHAADFRVTVSDRPLDHTNYYEYYYGVLNGYLYQHRGGTGEVTIDVGKDAGYVQLWEIEGGTLALGEVSIDATYKATKIGYTYDASGNRISRKTITTGNKSAGDTEAQGPQDYSLGPGQGLLLYPNPTSGILHFEATNLETEGTPTVKAKIYSTSGGLILEEGYRSPHFTIDISGQANGTYLLDLEVNGKKQHFTIIKQ